MATLTKDLQRFVWAFIGIVLACCCTGNLIRQDVPDGVVYTDLHKTVEVGSSVVLKCQFHGPPHGVYWKRGDNPSNAPNLITLVEGESDSGSCVKDKTCEMGDDYSLIIKNVSIADQGRYICRISNYRGILMHNVTDLKVYATPEGSYPVIQECEGYHGQNCTVEYSTFINITCSASRYFPNIDLLFLHGAQTVTVIKTFEWKNADGTKSKYISTRAPPSKIPYVCVAFNIPGSQDERTATILVFHQDGNGTAGSAGESERDKNLIIKIVVSVGVSVLGLCIPILLCCSWCRRKKTDGTAEERQHLLQGPVSLYELWYLASYKTTDDHKKKLRDLLTELGISDIKEGQLTPLETYNALCTWRNDKDKEQKLKALEKALGEVRYDGAWTDMYGRRKDKSIHVSPEKLKRILQHIGNVRHLNKFLNELIEGRTNIDEETDDNLQDIVQSCLKELTEWVTSRRYKFNPFVLLSFALERIGCTALDMVDFWVPENLEWSIPDDGLEKFLNELTARHCKRLAIYLKIKLKNLIIFGNNRYLFDTKSMITDWLDVGECSNFRKRCKLDDLIIRIGRYDLHDCFETISYRDGAGLLDEHPHPSAHQFDAESIYDDDIPHLAKMISCIPPDKKTHFQEKTGLNPDDIAEDDIKKWRDSVMATTSKDQSLNKFRSLRQELHNTQYKYIGSKSNKKHVTREELPSIALDLLMEDVRPIIEALDIDQSTVSTYKQQWDGKGRCTIELVKELLKNQGPLPGLLRTGDRDREDFCQVLKNMGFVDVARSVYIGINETEIQEGSSSVGDIHVHGE